MRACTTARDRGRIARFEQSDTVRHLGRGCSQRLGHYAIDRLLGRRTSLTTCRILLAVGVEGTFVRVAVIAAEPLEVCLGRPDRILQGRLRRRLGGVMASMTALLRVAVQLDAGTAERSPRRSPCGQQIGAGQHQRKDSAQLQHHSTRHFGSSYSTMPHERSCSTQAAASRAATASSTS